MAEDYPPPISVLGIVIVVAVIDWRFGVLAAVLVPVYMLLPRLRQGHHVRSAQRVQSATGELGGLATELIAGMRDIRAFNRQAWSLERLRRLLRELRDARVYQGFVRGWTWVTTTIFWIAYASIFLVLAEPIFGGEVTIGFALALAGYLSWLNREVTPMTMAYVDLLHAVGAARRLFDFLDTPAEDDAGDGKPLAVTRGEVEFRGVGAAYMAGTPVLTDVSFRVPGGSTTAIVGPSGAGKSTVVNLLLRFLQPSAGEIRLDGQDIGAASATEARRHIGVVFQDPVLFHGSIADNIGLDAMASDSARLPRRPPLPPRPTSSRPRATDSTPRSVSGVSACQAARRSASPSRAPSRAIRACWCSTRPRPPSTPKPSTWCCAAWIARARAARRW